MNKKELLDNLDNAIVLLQKVQSSIRHGATQYIKGDIIDLAQAKHWIDGVEIKLKREADKL